MSCVLKRTKFVLFILSSLKKNSFDTCLTWNMGVEPDKDNLFCIEEIQNTSKTASNSKLGAEGSCRVTFKGYRSCLTKTRCPHSLHKVGFIPGTGLIIQDHLDPIFVVYGQILKVEWRTEDSLTRSPDFCRWSGRGTSLLQGDEFKYSWPSASWCGWTNLDFTLIKGVTLACNEERC